MITRTELVAFQGDSAIKENCFNELKDSAHDGSLVRETDFRNGEDDWEHPVDRHFVKLEKDLGLPVWFLMLTEWLSSQMSEKDAILWGVKVIQAIPLGANLDKLWPRFACSLLSSPQGLLEMANGKEQQSLITSLYSLHTFSDVDASTWERKAKEAISLYHSEYAAQPASGMLAASWIAYASFYGAHGGDYARDKAARAVIYASRQTARTVFAGTALPIIKMPEACAIQAQTLLKLIHDLA